MKITTIDGRNDAVDEQHAFQAPNDDDNGTGRFDGSPTELLAILQKHSQPSFFGIQNSFRLTTIRALANTLTTTLVVRICVEQKKSQIGTSAEPFTPLSKFKNMPVQ